MAAAPEFSFREVVDAAPDAVIIVDATGTIVALGARCRELFGEGIGDMVGESIEVLVPDAHRETHRAHRDRYLAAPETRRMGVYPQMTARRLDGTEIPVEVALSPLETSAGRFVMCAVRDVSDWLELEARTELLAAIVASSDDAIMAADRAGVITTWNHGAEQLYGYGSDEVIGKTSAILAPTEEIAAEQDRMRDAVVSLGQSVHVETRRRRKDGTVIDVAVRYSPIIARNGETVGYSIIGRDITERVRMLDELGLRARLLDAVDASVIATDMHGVVRYWSGGSERLTGWTPDDVVGRHITAISTNRGTTEVMAHIQREGQWEGVFPLRLKDGGEIPGYVRGILFHDQTGHAAGMIAAAVDISERLAMEDDLRAARDFLAAVTENIGEGLLVIDDSGRIAFANHVAADMLAVPQRDLLATNVADLLAAEPERAGELLRELRPDEGIARLDTENALRGDGARLPVDITSSPIQQPGARQWALVMADDTERRARIAGLVRELDEIGWIGRITDALDHDALVLHAQPIVRIATGEICHHELLLRLRSGDGSLISPAQFLPVAERHGLITDIDRWVVARALELAADGRPVAINLSAATLADSAAPACIADQIRRSDADPSKLLFEITETAVLGDLHAGQHLVRRLAELGCQVALDDFGTGYGGFTYLKHLPISVLKIDTEFVQDLTENPASHHVVRAVVGLARSFELQTIAEGVEDETTLGILRQLGVDLSQGYFIGRPGAADWAS